MLSFTFILSFPSSMYALQIAVKRREAKSKGEKERYKHLNAEFQGKARRDKKAFFNSRANQTSIQTRQNKTHHLLEKKKKKKRKPSSAINAKK